MWLCLTFDGFGCIDIFSYGPMFRSFCDLNSGSSSDFNGGSSRDFNGGSSFDFRIKFGIGGLYVTLESFAGGTLVLARFTVLFRIGSVKKYVDSLRSCIHITNAI